MPPRAATAPGADRSTSVRPAQHAGPEGFTSFVFARSAAARACYAHHGCRVIVETDGQGNEEREPDVGYAWTP